MRACLRCGPLPPQPKHEPPGGSGDMLRDEIRELEERIVSPEVRSFVGGGCQLRSTYDGAARSCP